LQRGILGFPLSDFFEGFGGRIAEIDRKKRLLENFWRYEPKIRGIVRLIGVALG